jgi:hypothetical protein
VLHLVIPGAVGRGGFLRFVLRIGVAAANVRRRDGAARLRLLFFPDVLRRALARMGLLVDGVGVARADQIGGVGCCFLGSVMAAPFVRGLQVSGRRLVGSGGTFSLLVVSLE